MRPFSSAATNCKSFSELLVQEPISNCDTGKEPHSLTFLILAGLEGQAAKGCKLDKSSSITRA